MSVMNKLRPSMSVNEVKNIMGEPDRTTIHQGHLVYTYELSMGGITEMPHYLLFKDDKLIKWVADHEEGQRRQAQTSQSISAYNNFNLEQQRIDLEREKLRNNDTKYIKRGSQQVQCITYGNTTNCIKN